FAAVRQVSLEIRRGEFVSLLGPSGCGKSTLLRLVAGFEYATRGRIVIDGVDVGAVPPNLRPVNMVFQSYALFPHLTVWDNVAFGLRRRAGAKTRRPDAEIRREVGKYLALVGLEGMETRYPSQLSGGQQQRTALARALVKQPKVLLLDEPLGALDLKLRQEMQLFLKGLQQELGMTFLYVTHDQEEALTMSDHIAVFNEGSIEQVGTPRDVYEHPATEFVAGFVGTSNIVERDGRRVSIRPERIQLGGAGLNGDGGARDDATIRDVVFVGSFTRVLVETDGGERLTVVRPNDGAVRYEPGNRVHVAWRDEDTYEVQPPNQPLQQEVR
ncbi:MAG TPA: ABC transporter ATP-binding protein, partial [Gaiellaceae bacterium]|nr:ABC transporter ATP-binding protein [Gaiellaceae bacterium]